MRLHRTFALAATSLIALGAQTACIEPTEDAPDGADAGAEIQLAPDLDAEITSDPEAGVFPVEAYEDVVTDWHDAHTDHAVTLVDKNHPGASCVRGDLVFTRFPLDGTAGRDWTIQNYRDENRTADAPPTINQRDYSGQTGSNAITYDQHQGIDIDIPSFREMDGNTAPVRAVAAGTVVALGEAEADRFTSFPSPCTRTWNFVTIEHANGYQTIYGHLRRNSVVVNVGDTVAAGTLLGNVGSSGCSTAPHLHLEVHDCTGAVVSSHLPTSMWAAAAAPAYTQPSNVMDVMLRTGAISVAQIKDPAANPTLVPSDSTIGIGLSVAAVAGDSIQIILRRPDGTSHNSTTISVTGRFGHKYYLWNPTVSDVPGQWRVQVRVNGTTAANRNFNVSDFGAGFSELARHGISQTAYQEFAEHATAAGYRPNLVDGYKVGASTFINTLWGPSNGVAWLARHNLSSASYQTEVNALPAGYRLVQADSYLVGTAIRYAFIAEQRSGSWVAYHGVSGATHQANFDTYNAQGFRPRSVSGVTSGSTTTYTAVYSKESFGSWTAGHNMTDAQYQAAYTSNTGAGRRLAYLDAFMVNGAVRFNAIFNQRFPGTHAARHGMTSAQYQTEWATRTGQGLRTTVVTGYESGGASRFAAAWAP